jgi:hypothetical protein
MTTFIDNASHLFRIAAGVPEGAGGSRGPGAAPIATPVSQRSRKLPVRGCRPPEPPELLPASLGGRQSGESTAGSAAERYLDPAAYTAGRGFGRQVRLLSGSPVGAPPVFEPAVSRQSAGLGHTVV